MENEKEAIESNFSIPFESLLETIPRLKKWPSLLIQSQREAHHSLLNDLIRINK